MGNSLLCHCIDNCFKKGIILWGQKHCDWGGKVEEWGHLPPSYNVKKALLDPPLLSSNMMFHAWCAFRHLPSSQTYSLKNSHMDGNAAGKERICYFEYFSISWSTFFQRTHLRLTRIDPNRMSDIDEEFSDDDQGEEEPEV